MTLLSEAEVEAELAMLAGWLRNEAFLQKEFRFSGYVDVIAFVNRVFGAAEAANHHPGMLVHYRTVTVSFTSWDSGGITGRDIRMARVVERLATPH